MPRVVTITAAIAALLLSVASIGTIGFAIGGRLAGNPPVDFRLQYGALVYDSMTWISRGRPDQRWWWFPDADFTFVPAYRKSGNAMYIAIPLWPFAIGAGTFTVFAVRQSRSARRLRRCPSCGYNLSGLPLSSPCPECGSPRPS